jgi:thiamine transporter ThiT
MNRFLVWGADFHQETVTPAQVKFYLWVALFTAGNLVFPALVHSVPQGGLMFLPIYFFTLIAGYRWGLWAGLATALLSPLANTLLTRMPPVAMIDIILVKSVLLAVAASLLAKHTKQISLGGLVVVIVAYQLLGGVYEMIKAGSLSAALGDWQLGWPGLLIQFIVGGLVLGLWRGKKA